MTTTPAPVSNTTTRSNIHDILSPESHSPSQESIHKRPRSEVDPGAQSSQITKRARHDSPGHHRYNSSAASSISGHQHAHNNTERTYQLESANRHTFPGHHDWPPQSTGSDALAVTQEARRHFSSIEGTSESENSFSPRHEQSGRTRTSDASLTAEITVPEGEKQRKRAFTHRVKTGCLTCRKRKKKCDEGKPSCFNCTRGNHPCYWKKEDDDDDDAHGSIRRSRTAQRTQYPETMQEQSYGAMAISPRSVDVSRRPSNETAYSTLPDYHARLSHRELLRDSTGHEARMTGPARITYAPEGFSRPDLTPRQPLYGSVTHSQDYPTRPHPHDSAVSYSHPAYEPLRHKMTGQPEPSSQIHNPLDVPAGLRTEKERMLNGWPFDPGDLELRSQRDACALALYEFNAMAESGKFPEPARREVARPIFEPHMRPIKMETRQDTEAAAMRPQTHQPGMPAGFLAPNVDIEAPFHCHYGYNIRIAADVDIGANCRIHDAAPVEIGMRTIIGPNVTILTAEPDPGLPPPGQKRLHRAREVVIGPDCYIGAGVTLLPGTHIPPCSYIPSLVHDNVAHGRAFPTEGRARNER